MNEYVSQIQVPLCYYSFGNYQTNDADDGLKVLIVKSSGKIELELRQNHSLILNVVTIACLLRRFLSEFALLLPRHVILE